jgi:uncharacterized protein YggE
MRTTKLLLAFSFTTILSAQAPSQSASITAIGQATVSATPDLAKVDVGVTTQAATAQDATTNNATQASKVITALQGLLGASATIKTISYSLSPVYNNPPLGQNASIVGYMVTNIVEASLKDLTQIGKAIDTAIQSGANNVQGVSFSLQDQSPVQAQALKMAAATALTQAAAIAAGLNVHTGSVLQAVEALNSIYPLPFGAAGAATTTPIETGLVVVQASVTLEVAIAQ